MIRDKGGVVIVSPNDTRVRGWGQPKCHVSFLSIFELNLTIKCLEKAMFSIN